MSNKHSFTLKISNNVTEKEGINYLIENHSGFFKIDLTTKKELLDLLKIENRYLQAFDLIYIPDWKDMCVGFCELQMCLRCVLTFLYVDSCPLFSSQHI